MKRRICLGILAQLMLLASSVAAQTLQPGFTVRRPAPVFEATDTRADSTRKAAAAALLKAPPEVDIFASGAVRDVASNASNPSAVTGALGLRYRGEVFVVAGLVNVASKEDTIRSDFGASLLPPASGHALNAGLLDIRAPRWPSAGIMDHCAQADRQDDIRCHVGLHGYVSTASARWATALDTAGGVIASRVVPTWGMGLGLSYSFVNGVLTDDTRVALVLDAGVATRHIRGDITAMDSVRASLLGADTKNFIGGEFALNMQYNTIQAGITYYYMSGDIDGFSRGQVVAGVSIQSNLNSKPIKR